MNRGNDPIKTDANESKGSCVRRKLKSKQIVIFVRAYSASSARADALVQARQQFGSGAGAVTIVSCKEV